MGKKHLREIILCIEYSRGQVFVKVTWLWRVTRWGRTYFRKCNIIKDHIPNLYVYRKKKTATATSCFPQGLVIHILLGAQLVKTGQLCTLHIPQICSPPDYYVCNLKDVPETSDTFWNLKTSVPTTWRFHTDRHFVRLGLEFSQWSVGQSNAMLQQ
jgi:hypothetical protein